MIMKELVQSSIQNPFSSFWMAGFECSDQLNAFGNRVDLLMESGHLQLIDEDYKLIKQFNLKTVREGIRWSNVEQRAYQYNWIEVEHMMKVGKANGIQQVWDLCHFGYPDDLTPLHPMFARRFAALCRAFVIFYRSINPYEKLIVTPINEVSFISWLGGDVRGTSPYCIGHGAEVKYALMRAYIEGVAAMKEIDPGIIILTTEPLITMVPPLDATEEQIDFAIQRHQSQYESVDMLMGLASPELGGRPEYLDVAGFNYYYNNQWVPAVNECLDWKNPTDPRYTPLSHSLVEAYHRVQKPIALTETSHPLEDRPLWMNMVAEQCALVIEANVPLWGVCLYPIIDRPDWDHLHIWHKSGLWDANLIESGQLPSRDMYVPYAQALVEAQELITNALENVKHENTTVIDSSY